MRRILAAVALAAFGLTAACSPPSNAAVERSGPGGGSDSDRPAVNLETAIGASITASGAKCDGTADDTSAINTYLASFTHGGSVVVPKEMQCLINSGNLVVPANVRLIGAAAPFSGGYSPLSNVSGIILNPSYTITLNNGSQLTNLLIQRAGLVANPNPVQVISAVAEWGAETSVAVTLPANLGGQTLRDLFIIGFNTAIEASAGNFSVQRVAGDDYNGIEITTAGDNHYIDDVRFEPFYALSTPADSGSWARPGIAFNLHDGNTGGTFTRVFSFMYASGMVLDNVGVTQVANSGFEWQSSFGKGVTGTKGIRWVNHNAQTSLNNVYLNGFDTPVSDEGSGEVIMLGVSSPGSTNTTFNLAGAPVTPPTYTIGGGIAAGDTASITFTSMGLSGSPLTIQYAAVAGDTANKVASALKGRINSNQALIAAGVFAGVAGNVILVEWPQALSVSLSNAVTGGITMARGTGSQPAGSYGMVSGANAPGDGVHPVYTIGPGVFSWHIDSPWTGDNILPNKWLSVDPRSANRVAFTGVRWSSNPSVSGCGTGASVSAGSTDAGGTITEGADATGCTLTFRTPWWTTPDCLVSSPSGAAIKSYTTNPVALVLSHLVGSGNRFTYSCWAGGIK